MLFSSMFEAFAMHNYCAETLTTCTALAGSSGDSEISRDTDLHCPLVENGGATGRKQHHKDRSIAAFCFRRCMRKWMLRKPLFYASLRAIARRPSQEIMGQAGAEPVARKTPPLRVGVHVELDDRNQSTFRRLADFYFQKPL